MLPPLTRRGMVRPWVERLGQTVPNLTQPTQLPVDRSARIETKRDN